MTLSKAENGALMFSTIGSPVGTGTTVPSTETLEDLTEFAFKSRVGLLFLDECLRRGAELGPAARELHQSLSRRRQATDAVMVKLARRLDEVAAGEWVLFKSIKPFASTPNDTDWFPLDPRRHSELVEHLQSDGEFKLLEVAPRQTTLIAAEGAGQTDTTKRGGVYYIDCYRYPSTDYFIYLDPRRLRAHVRHTQVLGYTVPVLAPHVELIAIMFHNVFPERSFSIESYYLIKSYLDQMEEAGLLEAFVPLCREHKVEHAVAANLAAVKGIDSAHFSVEDPRVTSVLDDLAPGFVLPGFDPRGVFPHEFSNRVFWRTFASKNRDRTSLQSSLTQAAHMLNPVFFADVVRIIWRRSVKGGVYEQN